MVKYIPTLELVRVTLLVKKLQYFPMPTNNTYYGVVFSKTSTTLYLKACLPDVDRNMVYGTLLKFNLEDVKVDQLCPDTLEFLPHTAE